MKGVNTAPSTNIEQRTPDPGDRSDAMGVIVTVISKNIAGRKSGRIQARHARISM